MRCDREEQVVRGRPIVNLRRICFAASEFHPVWAEIVRRRCLRLSGGRGLHCARLYIPTGSIAVVAINM